MRQDLGKVYMQRHGILRKLRRYWQGDWWQEWSTEHSGIQSLFRDIARAQGDNVTPDYRVVHNILQEVCLKYQAYLSSMPMIRVYVDPPESSLSRRQAVKKERYLYGTWNQRPMSMSQVVNRMAWYLPLMGDSFLGALPDIENSVIRPVVRSPETAYPVPSYDGSTLDAVIFSWETPKSVAAKQFPAYNPSRETKNWVKRKFSGPSPDTVRVTEYSDGKEFARWVGKTKVSGVEHSYGFNLFDQIAFVNVPDEPFNHGAVEQIVTMNVAENLMRSLLVQAVLENIFPKYVLIDPSKAPEELDMGAGAVWGVNQGGDVKTLAPPLQALPVQQGFMAEGERAIKQSAGMSDANFGQPRGSIVTGKAINEMEAAGAGTNVEMVQGLGIGMGLVSWNEKAICMGRRMFKDETLNLNGIEKTSAISERHFPLKIKGSELVGGYRNEVIFLPSMNDHEKLVMGLQGIGAGIFSKEHVANTLGIPDWQAMSEEILGERIQDIVVGGIEQELLAAPTPEAGQEVEGRALAYLQGATPASTAPPPGGPAALPPGAGPPGGGSPPPGGGGGMPIADLPGGGQVAFPAMRMPQGAPIPEQPGAPVEGPAASPNRVTLEEAISAFQGLQVEGQVFLVGEIVQSNQTSGDIEVSVTKGSDRQIIADGLPQWAARLQFHTVSGEPGEPHVEVTPGAVPEQRGEEPDLEALLGGVA